MARETEVEHRLALGGIHRQRMHMESTSTCKQAGNPKGVSASVASIREAVRLLAEIKANAVLPIPDGWFSAEQFAEGLGVSVSHARRELVRIIASGKFVSQRWKKKNQIGRVCYQTIYKKKT